MGFYVSLVCVLMGWYLIFMLFIRQLVSRYRHLPTAKQPPLWRRLLHEPTTFNIETWIRKTPNDGLIRFFGFLNQERLLMTSADTLKQVLQKDASSYDKLPWLASLQSAAGVSGLVSSKGDLHKFHRRVTIAAFNNLSTRILYPAIWKDVRKAVEFLHQSTTNSSVIKLNPFFQLACLEISLHAGFGIDVDVLGNPQQSLVKDYRHPFELGERSPMYLKLLQICPVALQLPAVTLISRILGVDVSGMRDLLERSLKDKTRSIIRQDTEQSDGAMPHNIMDNLLHRGHNRLSERTLMRHAMTTMAANLDMVSNQLTWAIYALSHPRNLHVQTRLRNEIRKSFPDPPASMSWDIIDCQDYLLGVVNEVLRLYPNVSHRGRVANTDTTLHSLHLQKGTILVWPVYARNRDPQYWGPDADVFNPERWVSNSALNQETQRRDAFSFMTFGQGPRKCPGESYTRAVLASMLLGLIGRYEFQRPDGYPDVMDDGKGSRINFGIVMKTDIWARVIEKPGWYGSD